jgi:hypothetical protein
MGLLGIEVQLGERAEFAQCFDIALHRRGLY